MILKRGKKMQECKINNFLSVKLGGEDVYSWKLFIKESELDDNLYYELCDIPPERILNSTKYMTADDYFEEHAPGRPDFKRACHMLKTWYLYHYDTFLVYSLASLEILRELYRIGDPLAQLVFKTEIVKWILQDKPYIIQFLKEEGFLKYLTAQGQMGDETVLNLLKTGRKNSSKRQIRISQ